MSSDAYSTPLMIRYGEPTPLVRAPLGTGEGKATYDEAFVQDLAFRFPSCLPIREIDRAYEGLIPVCCELSTPAGPLDALYVTPAGRLVILEAKLWRNPEARRKVVAQILDYAKELSRWTYEDLQREVSRRLGHKGNVLYELVAEREPSVEEASFVDEVEKSLRRGRFLLLIVGDGIREGAGGIADFIESAGNLEFTFGLVELALYKGPEDDLLVQPRVIARTVEIQRSVVELPEGLQLVPRSARESHETVELTDQQKLYSDFWRELLGGLQLDDTSQPMANITKSENLFFSMPPSGSIAWISAFLAPAKDTAGVYLTFQRGSFGDRAYGRLSEESEGIDRELGIDVEWSSDGEKHTVILRRSAGDVFTEPARSEVQTSLRDAINRFVNVFRPRLERISRDLNA